MGDKTTLKLPMSLRDDVKAIAAKNRRSMIAQIEHWVKQEKEEKP